MTKKPKQIIIVGLGLVGGSLAAACRKAFPKAKIIGVTRSRTAINKAKKKRWIHKGFQDLEKAFAETAPLQFVVLCTPVDTLKGFLKRLDRIAPAGTVVSDAGSVKGFIVRWADKQNWRRIKFVGAHPMAGSHEQGINAADPGLFADSFTYVTPSGKTSRSALQLIKNFWRRISDRVIVISPEKHDRITAEISHAPHLLASLLVNSVSKKYLSFAGTGFLDTTRVAQGEPGLWAPIFLENRREVLRILRSIETAMKGFKGRLSRGAYPLIRQVLSRAQKRRTGMRINGPQ